MAEQARASRRGIIAWMFFDWATQPFYTLLTTFVFATYFAAQIDPANGQANWGFGIGIAGIIVALCAPVLGVIADQAGPRKPFMAVFSILIFVGCSALYFTEPGSPNAFWIAIIGYGVALIGIEFATVFNNAMMPTLVPRADLGKLSGNGWALGYFGGIIPLVIVLTLMVATPATGLTLLNIAPAFGIDPATFQGERLTGPLSGLWYLVFVLPLFLLTPDLPRQPGSRPRLRQALAKLGTTLRALPARRSYFAFLISSVLYRDGLNSIYIFGGIYAVTVLGMTTVQLGIFGILSAVTGIVGAFVGGRLDARFGPKPVVFWTCWILVVAVIVIVSSTPEHILFVIPAASPTTAMTVFYIAGGVIGAAAAAAQAASRTLLVDQVEEHETTEAFGLYALAGRAGAFLGPISIGVLTGTSGNNQIGMIPVVVLLALGALGLFFVRQRTTSRG